MSIYAGVNGKKYIKDIYVGVNGEKRRVLKAYVGVGGTPKLVYEAAFEFPFSNESTTRPMLVFNDKR